MWNRAKSSATFLLMGIPAWVVIVGIYESQPASLVVHLEERDVQCFIDGTEYPPESGRLGPVELTPGDHQLLILRGTRIVFAYPVSVETGNRKEVWARWKTLPGETSNGFQVQGAAKGSPAPREPLSS